MCFLTFFSDNTKLTLNKRTIVPRLCQQKRVTASPHSGKGLEHGTPVGKAIIRYGAMRSAMVSVW